ncbi:MAG: phage major tail tube protein [Desulfovibrionaceae bacterium]
MLPKILKNFAVFVDGKGYAGRVDEVALPKLTIKGEDYRGGGMDGPVEIDMGMEKLEATVTSAEYDAELFALFGLVDGAAVGVTFRGALQGDGDAVPCICELRGGFHEMDPGDWKPGEKASLKATLKARYYKLTIDARPVVEIDLVNMTRIINGVDQLASQRQALGL